MSGIFGVVSRDSIDANAYYKLRKWNESYGDLEEQIYEKNNIFLGIKPEKLKNYHSETSYGILKDNNHVGVVDGLIFDKTNSSYESYIFSEICQHDIFSLKTINGDFAGAIWNSDLKELILFRDHCGVRPLFYYTDSERVIFSSDIRGILAVEDIDSAIDEEWIYAKLSDGFIITPTSTEYKRIKCVPFGGFARFAFSGGEIKEETGHYWTPGAKKVRLKSRKAYTEEMRRLVEDAVKIRADATDFSLGAELSGGLDSGVIDLLLAKMGKECFFYSWTPSEDVLPYAEGDERLIIKDICEKAGIKCNFGGLSVKFGEDSLLRKRSPLEFTEENDRFRYDLKYAFPCYVNTSQIYETAAFMREKGIKIIFSGHGGDEGVSRRSNPYELFFYHEYYRYFRLMFSRSSVSKHRITETFKLIADNQRLAKNEFLKPYNAERKELSVINRAFSEKNRMSEKKRFAFPFDPKQYVLDGGSRNRLDVLAFFSACTGVRYFVPYLDYRVLDYALGIPRYLYHNWYINRHIFREAFKDLMPDSLYKVTVKQDMSYTNLHPESEKEDKKKEDNKQIKYREMLAELLDKKYWSRYLDFDVINNWVYGRTSSDESDKISECLGAFIQAQTLINRSREIKKI